MVTTIRFEVSYGQLAVFTSSLPQPFNDWDDRHVAQGFAWRPGSVSFRTLLQAGPCEVEIDVVDHAGAVNPDAIRVMEVPFDIPADGAIEIGGITETVPLKIPAGSFLLRCEFLPTVGDNAERVRLTFASKDTPRFAVVRVDPELSPGDQLLVNAKPASS